MKDANYRKHNDHSLNSSTYHKKDGTPVRAILKREAEAEIKDAQGVDKTIYLLKQSPNNESFLLESYSLNIDGLVNIAFNYVCEYFGEKKEMLSYEIADKILTVNCPEDSYKFYIVAIDECTA